MLEKYAKGDEKPPRTSTGASRAAWRRPKPEALRERWKRFRRQLPARRARRRPHHERGGHRHRGDADQLLRAAGRRLRSQRRRRDGMPGIYVALRRRPRRCGAAAASATTSPRSGRKGARVHAHAARRRRGRAATWTCSTESCAHGRKRRLAARRADGRAATATIPTCSNSSTAKHTKGRWNNFNISVGGHRRIHAGRRGRRHWRTRASRGAVAALRAAGDLHQRDDGLWVYRDGARARSVGRDHALDLRRAPSRASCSSRMNDDNNLRVLRDDRARPIRAASSRCPPTAAATSARSTSRASCAIRSRSPAARRRSTATRFARRVAHRRCACSTTCSTSRSGRCRSSARKRRRKRRIGVGFTGLGDALVMLGLRYDAPEGREIAPRDRAQRCATRRTARRWNWRARSGAFPLFDAELYLAARHVRIAPARGHQAKRSASTASATATCCRSRRPAPISLAFADNASNGIEPRVLVDLHAQEARWPTAARRTFAVEDHAWRLYRAAGRRRDAALPPTTS